MVNEIFNEIINMGIKSSYEAIDITIALYPFLSRSDQAELITLFKEHFNEY